MKVSTIYICEHCKSEYYNEVQCKACESNCASKINTRYLINRKSHEERIERQRAILKGLVDDYNKTYGVENEREEAYKSYYITDAYDEYCESVEIAAKNNFDITKNVARVLRDLINLHEKESYQCK